MAFRSPSESSLSLDQDSDASSSLQPRVPPLVPVNAAETARPKDIPVRGSLSQLKEIYKEPSFDATKWVDQCPLKINNAVENDQKTGRYAILVRQQASKDPRRKLDAHSIVIQSPWLQNALLSYVFEGYPGIVPEMGQLIFTAPFQPFVHRWSRLAQLNTDSILEGKAAEHLATLYDFLGEELKSPIAAYQTYIETSLIPWKDLWMLFEPGKVALASAVNTHTAVASEIQHVSYLHKHLVILHRSVASNGQDIGHLKKTTKIEEYSGLQDIDSFPLMPLDLHRNKREMVPLLTQRGAKYETLAGYHHKLYDGPVGIYAHKVKDGYLTGRVIIDIKSFTQYAGRTPSECYSANFTPISGHKDTVSDALDEDQSRARGLLSPYHLMLCNETVFGYSPQLNQWVHLYVEFVSDIQWQPTALENLVLPKAQKDIITAVSKSQRFNRHIFDDIIAGKGQGLVILLSGPPGTGKTLTAEAMAEEMQVPLIAIAFANLGSDIYKIEHHLTRILELAAQWNAIILLDECDVFLEARSADRLEQNNMVSIFLRVLEYYKGILFMTTNRRENIDKAFASRIHLSLEYPDLDYDSRLQIWKNVLRVSIKSPHKLSPQDTAQLAQVEANGRQIKNILKVAQLLAADQGKCLEREFVDTVLAVEKWAIPRGSVNARRGGLPGQCTVQ
ncbi:P-loop containing nucleoside triphosphate hydrolase protein [Aspergillus heterothallicus]